MNLEQNRYINQKNWKEGLDINPHNDRYLTFHKDVENYIGKNLPTSANDASEVGFYR